MPDEYGLPEGWEWDQVFDLVHAIGPGHRDSYGELVRPRIGYSEKDGHVFSNSPTAGGCPQEVVAAVLRRVGWKVEPPDA